MTEPDRANKTALEQRYGSLTTTGIHVTFFDENREVGYVKLSQVKRWDQGTNADMRKTKQAVKEAEAAQHAQRTQCAHVQHDIVVKRQGHQ